MLKWLYILMVLPLSIAVDIIVPAGLYFVIGHIFGVLWGIIVAGFAFVYGVIMTVTFVCFEGFGRKLVSWWPMRGPSLRVKFLYALGAWLIVALIVINLIHSDSSLKSPSLL